jgi:prepilin-type N-terminal cleavage/methylation domain-containing protein
MTKTKLGFTFVEVIIAMAIFAILVVGIFPAFLIGIKLNAVSKISVENASEAQSVMEEIYGYSLNNSLGETIDFLNPSQYTEKAISGQVTTLTKTDDVYITVIEFTANSPQAGMTKTLITVTKLDNPYDAQQGQAETILLFR